MKNIQTLLLAFFLLLVAVPIFYNLAGPAIFIYDEAIYANNALEMAMHGDPLVLKNNGEVSLYNTKPPLVIWFQALAIKILGPGEWAIRLPSALAALFTALLLFLFAHRSLKDYRIGWVAMLVLITSGGFLRNHVARSGDLDAMLVLWITFYSLIAFDYLLSSEKTNDKRHFTWIGIGVTLAFFSKSVAGFMPLLGLALAALVQRRLWSTLKKPYLYVVAGGTALLCVGFYLLRENLAPGYLEKVIFSEYSRFTENIMPWHEKPFWFYLDNMWNQSYFMPYLALLPVALGFGFFKKGRLREFTLLAFVFSLSYFLLISYPEVKLNYYDAPLYPFLALLIGVGMVSFWDRILPSFLTKNKYSDLGFVVLIAVLFFIPYRNTWNRIQAVAPIDNYEREGFAIRQLSKDRPDLKSYQVLMNSKHSEHLDQANFYIKTANHFAEANIDLIRDWKNIRKENTVLCCQSPLLDSLQQVFILEEETKISDCVLFKLTRIE